MSGETKINSNIMRADEYLIHAYNRYPITWERGEGVYLYDDTGKKYLDFAAGIAVCSLGYGHPKFKAALKKQIDAVMHTSNLFYTRQVADAAGKLAAASGLDRVFFTNSGAEAIEGALKTARKYAYMMAARKEKDAREDEGGVRAGYEIIAMENSFHGRTMGALSVTGNPHYREPFEPLIGGVKFAKLNDIESVKRLVSDLTCAVILEPVQGEGGIIPAKEEFLYELRALCDARDILLIFDEIQCGMGRCGDMFAWQGMGVMPDIMAMAKGIGGGVPVGAFAVTRKVADNSLVPGDHGTTYGGNPFACAAVSAVLDIFREEHIVEHVREVGAYLERRLDELAAKKSVIRERRGKCLMQGLVLSVPVGDVIKKAMDAGLIVISAGGNVLRLVPPLIITCDHVDEMTEKLASVL